MPYRKGSAVKNTLQEKVETIHYILTFISLIFLLICFATTWFTGKPALVQFDSLTGSVVLGSVFLLYSGWFIYKDILLKELTFSQALVLNLKTNPTFICVGLYWLVLILIPFFVNAF